MTMDFESSLPQNVLEVIDALDECLEGYFVALGACTDSDRETLVRGALACVDVAVQNVPPDYEVLVFQRISILLGLVSRNDQQLQSVVWQWIRGMTSNASHDRLAALQASIFELIIEDGIDWHDERDWLNAHLFFEMLKDPSTASAVTKCCNDVLGTVEAKETIEAFLNLRRGAI